MIAGSPQAYRERPSLVSPTNIHPSRADLLPVAPETPYNSDRWPEDNPGMGQHCLIFDRVRVSRVVPAGELPDGKAFKVYVENIGEGRPAHGAVRVEVSDSALGCLGEPVETWVRRTIRSMANAHENDGHKVEALIERGSISLDRRYVVT
jgi:hypothetical protein